MTSQEFVDRLLEEFVEGAPDGSLRKKIGVYDFADKAFQSQADPATRRKLRLSIQSIRGVAFLAKEMDALRMRQQLERIIRMSDNALEKA